MMMTATAISLSSRVSGTDDAFTAIWGVDRFPQHLLLWDPDNRVRQLSLFFERCFLGLAPEVVTANITIPSVFELSGHLMCHEMDIVEALDTLGEIPRFTYDMPAWHQPVTIRIDRSQKLNSPTFQNRLLAFWKRLFVLPISKTA